MVGLFKNWASLHHAHVVKGASSTDLWNALKVDLAFKFQANPDANSIESETFGIDEARELSAWAIRRPFGERKVAVISTSSITSEAQNALLKLFEEPTPDTYFFLVLPSLGSVLPTLLSRVQVIEVDEAKKSEQGKIFLDGDVSKRLKIIAPILKNKDKDRARNLVGEIAGDLDSGVLNKEKLETILFAERALQGRAPSLKMILELLSLTL